GRELVYKNYILATSDFNLGDYSKAVEIYKLSHTKAFGGIHTEKYNNMAESYIGIGNPNEAINLLEHFINFERRPNAKTYYVLGNAYNAINNKRKAKEAYKIAAYNGSKEAQDILNKK